VNADRRNTVHHHSTATAADGGGADNDADDNDDVGDLFVIGVIVSVCGRRCDAAGAFVGSLIHRLCPAYSCRAVSAYRRSSHFRLLDACVRSTHRAAEAAVTGCLHASSDHSLPLPV